MRLRSKCCERMGSVQSPQPALHRASLAVLVIGSADTCPAGGAPLHHDSSLYAPSPSTCTLVQFTHTPCIIRGINSSPAKNTQRRRLPNTAGASRSRTLGSAAGSRARSTRYGTFRLNFHHFDHFELDLCRHIHVRGAAFACLRLKWADIVLI